MWRIGDEAGFDHCWCFDHFVSLGGEPTFDIYDGWVTLAAMAALTKRVRVGNMVTGNTYRHPAVLAKMAVTLDHLSGGRLEMGIGAAWMEPEHRMLGIEFPTVGQRMTRLDEACRLMRLLWTEPLASFQGKHYALANAIAEPKPLQKPHPPLWIGGKGERRLLRIVARHADVWNASVDDPEEGARLAAVLDQHCGSIGRDPATIRRSAQVFKRGSVDALARKLEAFARAGFTELVIGVTGDDPVRDAEHVAAELPRLRGLP